MYITPTFCTTVVPKSRADWVLCWPFGPTLWLCDRLPAPGHAVHTGSILLALNNMNTSDTASVGQPLLLKTDCLAWQHGPGSAVALREGGRRNRAQGGHHPRERRICVDIGRELRTGCHPACHPAINLHTWSPVRHEHIRLFKASSDPITVKFTTVSLREPRTGDKFASRHGQVPSYMTKKQESGIQT